MTVRSALLLILAAASAVAFCPAAEGQETKEAPPPRLNLRELGILPPLAAGEGGEPATVTASFRIVEGTERGTLSVTARIDPGWHVYSITQPDGGPRATKINVADAVEFRLLGPFQPDRPPHVRPPGGDNPFTINVEEHEERVTWTAPLELTEGVKPEDLQIAVHVTGQVCKDQCLELDKKPVARFAGYDQPPKTPGEYRPDPMQAEVVVRGHIEPAAVEPGGKAKLVLTATPSPGWHVYAYEPVDPDVIGGAKPTLIVLPKLAGWRYSPLAESEKPKVEPGKAGLPASRHHEGPIIWTVELTAPPDAEVGEHILTGYLGIQTCKNQGGCLPPQAVQFRATVNVAKTPQAGTLPLEFLERQPKAPASRGGTDEPAVVSTVRSYNDVAKLAKEHQLPCGKIDLAQLGIYMGLGLLGGLILNLMPCVLPVIGLKVLSFVQQGGESRGRIFFLNLWFALGLVSVFLVLATLASFGSLVPYLGENLNWGQQFTYTSFKVAMVVIVFAFALSFLGVWEVPIPGFAQSSSSSKLQSREGASGAFFKGVFTTLLATPCSGPFLGPTFGYTLTQPPLVTYIIFTAVGLGMASPYLVIGAFPGLVRWLPKPGLWMDTVKQLMGFLLLGTVVYLFATISADWFIPTLALMMATWLACWIIGKVPVYESAGKQIRAWAAAVGVAAAIGWLSFTWLGPAQHLYEWQPYSPSTISKLQSEGKTVMVDFTADWCPTCHFNFARAINTHRVKEAIERNGVVPLLADWTDRNDTIRQKLAELDSRSIPFLAIYPAGKPNEVIVLPDLITESQLLEALKRAGPSKSAEGQQMASVKAGAE